MTKKDAINILKTFIELATTHSPSAGSFEKAREAIRTLEDNEPKCKCGAVTIDSREYCPKCGRLSNSMTVPVSTKN